MYIVLNYPIVEIIADADALVTIVFFFFFRQNSKIGTPPFHCV